MPTAAKARRPATFDDDGQPSPGFEDLMKTGAGVLMLGVLPAVFAQVPDDVRGRLGRDGVVTTDAWVFASATGTLRGTREGEEQRQATRAMSLIARSLCRFEPGPGRRLEAGVTGFAMVSSIQRGRDVEVIMKAPLQSPSCKVTVIEIKQEAPATPSNLAPKESVPEPDSSVQIATPGYIREKNMTIRVLNAEY